jgi:hypothetical protein
MSVKLKVKSYIMKVTDAAVRGVTDKLLRDGIEERLHDACVNRMDYKQLGLEIKGSHSFYRDLSEYIEVDMGEVAEHIDNYDLASCLSDHVCWDELVTDNINEDRVAENIEYDNLAESVLRSFKDELNEELQKEMLNKFVALMTAIVTKAEDNDKDQVS